MDDRLRRSKSNRRGADQHTADSNEELENIELDPCAGTECSGIFQVPVPPSCKCACPSADVADCPSDKEFDGNLCACICRDINVNCPGKADFNFDVCNCVCPLQENDCGPGERFNTNGCTCIDIPSSPPPTQQPSCSLEAQLDCQGYNKYLDPKTCQCTCRRFLVKKTYHNYPPRYRNNYRHGRSTLHESGFDDQVGEEARSRRSTRSRAGSQDHSQPGSQPRNGNEGDEVAGDARFLYSLTCPAWKKADLNACICYW